MTSQDGLDVGTPHPVNPFIFFLIESFLAPEQQQNATGEVEYGRRHEDAEVRPLWDEELEVHDKDGEERVDIAVLFNVKSR